MLDAAAGRGDDLPLRRSVGATQSGLSAPSEPGRASNAIQQDLWAEDHPLSPLFDGAASKTYESPVRAPDDRLLTDVVVAEHDCPGG